MNLEITIMIIALMLSISSLVISLLVWKEFSAFQKFWVHSISMFNEDDLSGDGWDEEDSEWGEIPVPPRNPDDVVIDIQDYLRNRYDPDNPDDDF